MNISKFLGVAFFIEPLVAGSEGASLQDPPTVLNNTKKVTKKVSTVI